MRNHGYMNLYYYYFSNPRIGGTQCKNRIEIDRYTLPTEQSKSLKPAKYSARFPPPLDFK